MSEERRRRTPTWLNTMTVVLVLLAGYVGGYFWLGERMVRIRRVGGGGFREPHRIEADQYRLFPDTVLTTIYFPVGWVESQMRGTAVTLEAEDSLIQTLPYGHHLPWHLPLKP